MCFFFISIYFDSAFHTFLVSHSSTCLPISLSQSSGGPPLPQFAPEWSHLSAESVVGLARLLQLPLQFPASCCHALSLLLCLLQLMLQLLHPHVALLRLHRAKRWTSDFICRYVTDSMISVAFALPDSLPSVCIIIADIIIRVTWSLYCCACFLSSSIWMVKSFSFFSLWRRFLPLAWRSLHSIINTILFNIVLMHLLLSFSAVYYVSLLYWLNVSSFPSCTFTCSQSPAAPRPPSVWPRGRRWRIWVWSGPGLRSPAVWPSALGSVSPAAAWTPPCSERKISLPPALHPAGPPTPPESGRDGITSGGRNVLAFE